MSVRKLGRRPRKTREEVYRAAVDLFMQHGVHDVTMQQIADHAETARSTVFNHYPNKNDLLEAFYRRLAASVISQSRQSDAQGFLPRLMVYFDITGREAQRYAPILRDIASMALGKGPLVDAEAEIDDDMVAFLTELVEDGQASAEVRSDVPAEEIAGLILGLVTVTNHEWVGKGQISDLADDHKRRFALIYEGLEPTAQ